MCLQNQGIEKLYYFRGLFSVLLFAKLRCAIRPRGVHKINVSWWDCGCGELVCIYAGDLEKHKKAENLQWGKIVPIPWPKRKPDHFT